jgi:PAS domain S-box-containing protein
MKNTIKKDDRISDLETENALLKSRLKYHEQHNESRIKLKTIFDNSFEGIMLINDSARIIEWNNCMEKITGIPKESVLQKYVWNIQYSIMTSNRQINITEEELEKVWHEKVQILNPGEVLSGVGKILDASGQIKFIEDLVSPVIIDGKKFFCVFQRDITAHKLSSVTIEEQNAELTKLNNDKDRFLSILAHDLKSPFGSILGFIDLLVNNYNGYDASEIEEIISTIQKSAHRTFNLLEDLLQWINARSGKLISVPQDLNFYDICEEIITGLEPLANDKNIKIIQQASEGISLFADKNILKTVLRNLVYNAIKFSNRDGLVVISVKPGHHFVTIIVTDNGIGIEHTDLKKLFDHLHRISTPGTENESGTGLGLLLCKELIEKSGGRIWAESEPGKGSRFKFTIQDSSNHN